MSSNSSQRQGLSTELVGSPGSASKSFARLFRSYHAAGSGPLMAWVEGQIPRLTNGSDDNHDADGDDGGSDGGDDDDDDDEK